MNTDQLDAMLLETLEDGRLSRAEKKALREVFADLDLDPSRRAQVRARAFDIARDSQDKLQPAALLSWLERVVKVLDAPPEAASSAGSRVAEAHFSPGDVCRQRITALLDSARRTVDICVFTITDDRITSAIERSHRRGVKVRVISDNDKALDRGADTRRLAGAGVPVRFDETSAHMHHKYAIFDRQLLLTGSYNWTRSAARANHENIVVTDDPRLTERFTSNFDELWRNLG